MENHSPILRVLLSRTEMRAVYDRLSGIYDALADHAAAPVGQAALERLNIKWGMAALEIGPGTGHGVAALAERVGPRGWYSRQLLDFWLPVEIFAAVRV